MQKKTGQSDFAETKIYKMEAPSKKERGHNETVALYPPPPPPPPCWKVVSYLSFTSSQLPLSCQKQTAFNPAELSQKNYCWPKIFS